MKASVRPAVEELSALHLTLPDSPDNQTLLHNERPTGWINPEPKGRYDLVVVGGGPAGLTAATVAASHGAKVALIEKDLLGGECFNIGCIPSKAIIRTSRLYADMRNAENFGGKVPGAMDLDFEKVMLRMQRIRAQVSGHIAVDQLQAKGIDVYFGHAQFAGPRHLTINTCHLTFKKCLIATGSRPVIPDIPGLAAVDYLTNETVFNLKTLPESLLVIGGGATGCELAQAFSRLGTRVIIVQTDPMFLTKIERDGAQILSDALAQDGVSIYLNSDVANIRIAGDQKIAEIISAGNKTTVTVTTILIGVGQTPNTDGLNLQFAHVDCNEGGLIKINRYFATSNPHIFAVGSVCDEQDLNHIPVAAAQSAALNALSGKRHKIDGADIPWCIYTDPEIAHIGLQVVEARGRNIPVKTFTILMHQVDRAIADSEDTGFVKIHVKEGTDKILGATIVARHAGDIMNAISLAMGANIGLSALADIHYPYPTQGDVIRMAAVACSRTLRDSWLRRLRNFLTVRTFNQR